MANNIQDLEILPCDAPVMLTPCRGIQMPKTEKEIAELEDLVVKMEEICAMRRGLGLSANQLGKSVMLFIMRDTLNGEFTVCINPSITRQGKEWVQSREGCLSAPGKSENKVRKAIIDVEYIDESGDVVKTTLKRLKAIVFQHELSHLHGEPFLSTGLTTRAETK